MLVGPVEQRLDVGVDPEQRRAELGQKRLQLLRMLAVRRPLEDALAAAGVAFGRCLVLLEAANVLLDLAWAQCGVHCPSCAVSKELKSVRQECQHNFVQLHEARFKV
jgi:hypothetical protein